MKARTTLTIAAAGAMCAFAFAAHGGQVSIDLSGEWRCAGNGFTLFQLELYCHAFFTSLSKFGPLGPEKLGNSLSKMGL